MSKRSSAARSFKEQRRQAAAERRQVKMCAYCGREMTWRKKWARVWDRVELCSAACRRAAKRRVRASSSSSSRSSSASNSASSDSASSDSAATSSSATEPESARVERCLLRLLRARTAHRTLCPSECARALFVDEAEWRSRGMSAVRSAARRLAQRGALQVEQRGRVVDAATARGPIRYRLIPND